ncbi:MAG: sulfotransferase family 2 domain-containing protein [Pseudomonadota bacterium]
MPATSAGETGGQPKARPLKKIPKWRINAHLRRYYYEPPTDAQKADAENPPVIFVHIPKTAGTRLTHIIAHNLSRTGLPKNLFYSAHRFSAYDLSVHYGPHRKLVLVLRDPVDRFISAYYSRYNKGAPDYKAPWSRPEKRFFKRYPTLRRLAFGMLVTSRARMERRIDKVHLLHMGYVRFFGSLDGVEQDWDNIATCMPIDHLDAKQLGFETYELPEKTKENRGLPRPKVTFWERAVFQRFLVQEYRIYARLRERARELHGV